MKIARVMFGDMNSGDCVRRSVVAARGRPSLVLEILGLTPVGYGTPKVRGEKVVAGG